jgi:hypothetical protein
MTDARTAALARGYLECEGCGNALKPSPAELLYCGCCRRYQVNRKPEKQPS